MSLVWLYIREGMMESTKAGIIRPEVGHDILFLISPSLSLLTEYLPGPPIQSRPDLNYSSLWARPTMFVRHRSGPAFPRDILSFPLAFLSMMSWRNCLGSACACQSQSQNIIGLFLGQEQSSLQQHLQPAYHCFCVEPTKSWLIQ